MLRFVRRCMPARLINAGAFVVVVFLVAWFGLKPMAAALTAPATPAIAGAELRRRAASLPTPEAAAGLRSGPRLRRRRLARRARSGPNPLDDLRQKIRPAPQERLARMVDINEERTAQILRKWAAPGSRGLGHAFSRPLRPLPDFGSVRAPASRPAAAAAEPERSPDGLPRRRLTSAR